VTMITVQNFLFVVLFVIGTGAALNQPRINHGTQKKSLNHAISRQHSLEVVAHRGRNRPLHHTVPRRDLSAQTVKVMTVVGFLTPFSNPLPSIAVSSEGRGEEEVDRLFRLVSNAKPSDFTKSEQRDLDTLIDSIISRERGKAWRRDLLPGKWRVAYIRAGKDGGGLDRRIPFPELPFNESYQRFTQDSVTNIGELLGPALRVEVSGSLSEDNEDSITIPKRFRADISEGNLCVGEGGSTGCIRLPISGLGTFDGVFLGENIRIGQNLNGSGALVVQTRVQTTGNP